MAAGTGTGSGAGAGGRWCWRIHMRTTYNNKEGGANSAGTVGADAAVVAAAAAHPVLAEFEWLRKDRAHGVCWSTHPERGGHRDACCAACLG